MSACLIELICCVENDDMEYRIKFGCTDTGQAYLERRISLNALPQTDGEWKHLWLEFEDYENLRRILRRNEYAREYIGWDPEDTPHRLFDPEFVADTLLTLHTTFILHFSLFYQFNKLRAKELGGYDLYTTAFETKNPIRGSISWDDHGVEHFDDLPYVNFLDLFPMVFISKPRTKMHVKAITYFLMAKKLPKDVARLLGIFLA